MAESEASGKDQAYIELCPAKLGGALQAKDLVPEEILA